jgi:poly(A) polymerase
MRLEPEIVALLREPRLARLLAVLNGNGEEARVVGGAVRNALIGVPIGEVDLATTAVPQTVVARIQEAGFKAVPTGIEHGTVTAVAEGRAFEITTLREDVETDGRYAVVRFGRDWRRDAERRDFTINALSLGPDGTLYDYCGGRSDLAARRVRFIGDPDRRIAEDYLRVLRFFRFFAAYGEGEPDREGYLACARARDGLGGLSRERVRAEFLKLFAARRADVALGALADAGLYDRLFANAPQPRNLKRLIAIEAVLALEPDPVLRMAVAAVRIAEDADQLRERLRLSNDEWRRLGSIADRWWRIDPLDQKAAREALYSAGPAAYRDRALMAFAHAVARTDDPAWVSLVRLPERWTVPRFPLAAADFLSRGVEKGPALGAAIRAAEGLWIAAGFPDDRDAIERFAAEAIAGRH